VSSSELYCSTPSKNVKRPKHNTSNVNLPHIYRLPGKWDVSHIAVTYMTTNTELKLNKTDNLHRDQSSWWINCLRSYVAGCL